MKQKSSKLLRRRITKAEMREILYHRRYVLPNAVTVSNMFCGFLSIVYAARAGAAASLDESANFFLKAAWAIIVAIIFDGFDGRVARRFNATSKFGLEFDSLSDLISFGVAPAVLMYQWCFRAMADEIGVLVCFVFCLGAACRLARFNVTETNLKAFEGMPSPAAAGIVASIVCVFYKLQPNTIWHLFGFAGVMILVGYLMVSHLEYFSIKQLRMNRRSVFLLLVVGFLIAMLWYAPGISAMVVFVGYALSAMIIPLIKSGIEASKAKSEMVPEETDEKTEKKEDTPYKLNDEELFPRQ